MASPTNRNVNVKNKFLRTKKKGLQSGVNQLDLSQGNWSIDGVDVTATADQINNAAAGGLSDVNNVGTGEGVFKDIITGTINLKTLTAGANVSLTPSLDGNEIEISATGGGGGGITNGTNLGTGAGVFFGVSGSDMEFKSLKAGSNITLGVSSGEILISSTGGGGGGNHPYVNTWYVASNGSDANTGTSINEPKLTLAGARAAFTGLNNVIIIEDNGTYDSFFVEDVADAVTQINAPSATFVGTIGPVFSVGDVLSLTAPTLIVDCYKIIGNGAIPPLITYSGNPSSLSVTAKSIDGNGQDSYVALTGNPASGAIITSEIIIGGMEFGTSVIVSAKTLVGDILTSTAGIYIGVLIGNVDNHIGNISGDGSTYGYFGSVNPAIETKLFTTNLNIDDKAITRQCYKQEVKTSTYEITPTDSNKLFTFDSASFPTCRLPDFATNPNFPAGFRCWASMRGTGQIFFNSDDTIQSVNNYRWSNDDGALVEIFLQENTGSNYIWAISGDLVSSNLSALDANYYFSDVKGNNASGNGSLGNPWKDPFYGYAQVSALSPSNKVNLIGIDAATYSGELLMDNGNINLIAPQATLYSSSGDAIQTTFFGEQVQINLKQLYSTFVGGKALNNVGNNQIILNVDVLSQGDIVQGGTGVMFIQSDNVQTPLICTAAGEIRGQTAEWIGTFTEGPGTIRVVSDSGFAFPAAASPYFQSTPTSFAGAVVGLSASFVAGKVIVNNNAGPCTWTIDTGTNLSAQFSDAVPGDTFNVYVYNPLAATISLSSNTDAAVTGASSNMTSFVLTLRYGGGVSWDIYI